MSADIIHLETVDSTNMEVLRRLKKSGLKDGAAILADYQSGGRGRASHAWRSEPGQNLLCSWWLELDLPYSELSGFSLLPSLAVADWLFDKHVVCGLKWPNDVRWQGRKLCGILIQGVAGKKRCRGAVVGIGLNLRSAPELTEYLSSPVSLAEITGAAFTVLAACEGIGHYLTLRRDKWLAGEKRRQLDEWLALCDHLRKPLQARIAGKKIEGVMLGLGDAGQLLLDCGGTPAEIWADDVLPMSAII